MSVVRVSVPPRAEERLPEPPFETVLVPTQRFGDLVVPVADLFAMPEGMHGFPDLKQYLLIPPAHEGGLFYWWQAVDDPALAFPVCDPCKFFPAYRIQSGEADVLRLHLQDRGSLQVLVVVTVPTQRPESITANLLGPLVLDGEQREAWQLICERSDHRVGAPLLPAILPTE